MDDTISRQAAIDALQKEIDKCIPPFNDVIGAIRCGVRLARNIVEDLPSAERHGRWIIYPVSPWDGEDVKCSVCGEKGCASYWNYCPHCGSQMDLEDEE